MNLLQPPTESIFAHLGLLFTPSFEQVIMDRRQDKAPEGQTGEAAAETEKLHKLLTRQVVDIAEMQTRSKLEEKDALNRMKRRHEANVRKADLVKERFKRLRVSDSLKMASTQPGQGLGGELPSMGAAAPSKADAEFKDCQSLEELEGRIRDKLKALLMRYFSSNLAQPEAVNADVFAETFAPTMAAYVHENNKRYIAVNDAVGFSEFRFGSSEYIEELHNQLRRVFKGKTALGPEYRAQKILQFSKATLKQLKLVPAGHEWE